MKSRLPSIEQFVRERNEALFSFDEKKIRAYCKKYGASVPNDHIVLRAGVCKAICAITNAPRDVREKAEIWLKENNFKEGF